jgi:hypothetical protein
MSSVGFDHVWYQLVGSQTVVNGLGTLAGAVFKHVAALAGQVPGYVMLGAAGAVEAK